MNHSKKRKLIFVYNAQSGILNAALDGLHKLFSPSTYKCGLCSLTHGSFGMRKEWKDFLESLDLDIEFKHKDEWRDDELPAIYLDKIKIVNREQLKANDSVKLISLLKNKTLNHSKE